MKCIIPGLNVKVFARAIHSIARIGEELYVQPSKNGVSFRTVDSSRSAFGSFFFNPSFFSLFDFKIASDEGDEENFKCKVAMKACLNAFRSVNALDKSVEKCKLIIDPAEDRLVVIMTCKHGIQKTFNLAFIECETLEAEFDRSGCSFGITSQSRVLCDAFLNFRPNQEEVTLAVNSQKTVIRNYVDDEPDPSKSIHTELTLEADEFDDYKIESPCEVTFSLKEVRSLLTFSEPVNLPVSIVFSKPGMPIIFCVDNANSFEANFVLATFNSQIAASGLSCRQEESASSSKSKRTSIEEVPRNEFKRSSEFISDVSSRLEESKISSRVSTFGGSIQSPKLINKRMSSLTNGRVSSPDFSLPCPAPARSKSIDPQRTPVNSSHRRKSDLKERQHSSHRRKSDLKERQQSANVSREPLVKRVRKSGDPEAGVVVESEEEELPGTPPAKRRKYYFKRCFESTFDANNISAFRRVLAEDSDEENHPS